MREGLPSAPVSDGEQQRQLDPAADESRDGAARTGDLAGGENVVAQQRPRPAGIRSGRLAGLGMWASIWVLSWPILTESVLNWLVAAVDTVLGAGLSEAAADALAGGGYVSWFMGLIGMSLGVGATALVSRSVGKGRMAVANAAVGQTMLLAAGAGVLTLALVWAIAPLLGGLLELNEEAHALLVDYLRTVALGVPALTVMASGIASCRGAGDSLRPLWIMVGVNAVNIGVSWVASGVDATLSSVGPDGEITTRTLLANPFSFEMGVRGIALGTVAAWVCGAIAVVLLLMDGRSGVRLRAKRMRPHVHTMRRLVRIATPSFAETLGMWLGNFVVIMMVGWLAIPGLLGAHMVAVRIEAVSFLPGFSMAVAAATLAGQHLGARSPDRARTAALRCALVGAGIMGTLGVLFMLFPAQITGLFTPQETHLRETPRLIQIAGAIQIPFAIALVLRSVLRASGDATVAMVITWSSTWGIRLPLVYALSGVDIPWGGGVIENPFPFELGLTGVWYGLCGEIALRSLLFGGRFAQGAWMRKKV